MAHGMAINFAGLGFPTRTAFAVAASASGIEAETANDHEGVTVTNVDGDPVAFSLFAVIEKSVGSEMSLHEAGFTEDITGGPAAVVTGIVEAGMTAAVFVGLVKETVGGGDCEFDFLKCKEWCASFSVFLQVYGSHELLFMLDGAFSPLLIAATTDEGEAGEQQQ